jgi:hypothetical protein
MAIAGCAGLGGQGLLDEEVEAPNWRVGDTWVYERTGSTGESLIYERKVTAVFMHGPNLVYELKSGLRNHPLQDYHLYRTDDLRFVGSDAREGSTLLKRVSADEPIVFHYVFPLVPGQQIEREGMLQQRVTGHAQSDPVRVTATVEAPRGITLGERVYQVVPYEIRIRFEATPFMDEAVIRGHWAPSVGQSVLTILEEGGQTVRHELLYYERVEPEWGSPAYSLVSPLESRHLERGFEVRLSEQGWERYLFHVEEPARLGIDVTLPGQAAVRDRLDVVSLRPLGYTRAGIADQITDLATGGLFLHVSATGENGRLVHHHAAQGAGNDVVYLQPGQVYELIVSSNQGGVNVRIDHAGESQAFAPVEKGDVEVLSGEHQHVQGPMGPGPQSVHDAMDVRLENPHGERIEGLVYVVNHGTAGDPDVELEAHRGVYLAVDTWAWQDEKELYAYYFGYVPRDGFLLRTGFEYRATLALEGTVDYEMGVLLLRLLPP